MTIVLYGLNMLVYLGFIGVLVFLCVRTRSKGLMLITALQFLSRIFYLLLELVLHPYIDQHRANYGYDALILGMGTGELVKRVFLIERCLYGGLCLLGVFIIYREWKLGKFGQPSSETITEHEAG